MRLTSGVGYKLYVGPECTRYDSLKKAREHGYVPVVEPEAKKARIASDSPPASAAAAVVSVDGNVGGGSDDHALVAVDASDTPKFAAVASAPGIPAELVMVSVPDSAATTFMSVEAA